MRRVALALSFVLGLAPTAAAATRLVCQVWGQRSYPEAPYIGQHSKVERLVVNDDLTLTFDATYDGQILGQRGNTFVQGRGAGYLTPAGAADEYYLTLQYESVSRATCDMSDGRDCSFAPAAPSSHREFHVCFGSPVSRLVCNQVRAYDPGVGAQAPAEITTCVPF